MLCELKFENDTSYRRIKTNFTDPTRSFDMPCDVCGGLLDVAHLCVNSHLSCNDCSRHCVKCQKDVCVSCEKELRPCYICREGLCQDCIITCGFCAEIVCQIHMSECAHCSERACYFCSDSCQICGTRACDASISTCGKCGKRLCEADSVRCVICQSQFCHTDTSTCAICGKKHCLTDAAGCASCEQSYCSSCLDGKLCVTCGNLRPLDSHDGMVARVVQADPKLAKFKKWSGSKNEKYHVFRVKKLFGSRIITYDVIQDRILVDKKAGWI